MPPLPNARRHSSPMVSTRPLGWSIAVLTLSVGVLQACIHAPGPMAVPAGVYHFRFVEDSAAPTPEEWKSPVGESGSLALAPRERASCDSPEEKCWDLEGEYTLTPAGYAVVRVALQKAGIADSIPARGRATGGWRERPGGTFYVILNDSGPRPRLELRAAPGRKRWNAEGEWCLGRCTEGAAGKLSLVRSKR